MGSLSTNLPLPFSPTHSGPMVLTSKNLNIKSRVASNSQNVPPRQAGSRSLAHRLRGSLEAARKNTRVNGRAPGSNSTSTSHPGKPTTTPSKTQASKDKTARALDFSITALPTPILEVEMRDATPSSSAPKKTPVRIPQELPRPYFDEVDYSKLTEIDESLQEVPITFLRQHLDVMGQDFLQSLGSTTISPAKPLGKEMDITINDLTSIAPSHVLAVQGPRRAGKPNKICLYAAHSVVFAAQCARMPKFPPTLPLPPFQPGQQTIRVPVFPIAVPHAESFPQLLKFLYCKRPMSLIREMIPLPPPPMLAEDPAQVIQYATELAHTFTDAKLLHLSSEVHGLWRNLCGFNIDNEQLWDTLDLIWKVLLTALAISTGKPELMITKQPSSDVPVTSS